MYQSQATKISNDRSSSSANRTRGIGKSMPAVPVLQQKSEQLSSETNVPEKSSLEIFDPKQTHTDGPGDIKPFSLTNNVTGHTNSTQNPSKLFQLKADTPNNDATSGTKPFIQKKNNTGLPDDLKAGVETLSGYSMNDVKVHYNSDKPAQLQAFAYAQGTDIHVAPGQEKHLPHEAWHVAQQKQGRVQPTLQMKGGMGVNDDDGLEQEADTMGTKALQVKNAAAGGDLIAPGSLSAASNSNAAVQRKLGLELEVAVPIDKMGVLSEDDKKILKGTKTNAVRLQQLFNTADAGYGKFAKAGRVAFHADHSSRVAPAEWKPPYRVMGHSILEMVFDPPVETQEELDETMEEINTAVSTIQSGTSGLKKRVPFDGGVHIGPIDGDSKPAELSWKAAIHVNVGIDPRRLHKMLNWYSASKYKPSREVKQIPMEYAETMAERIVKAFSETSGVSNKDAQYWNGLRGLTTILVLYLLSGADKSELKSSVKNFATLLSKTRFGAIIKHSMTPKERELLKDLWEEYKKVLIQETRPGEDERSSLILRTNGKGKLKDGSWKIKDLFTNTAPALVGDEKEIDADDVGPVRSDQDKVAGGARRKGIVLEFRSLPGRYEPDTWAGIAKDFLDKANEENSVKDYKELPPPLPSPDVPEVKEKAKDITPNVQEVRSLPLDLSALPQVTSIRKENIVVQQSGQFWLVDQEVTWEGDIWKVIKKEGIKKYTLSFIRKA